MSGYPILPDPAQQFLDEIRSRLRAEAEKPLVVVVMGQTGVGKSSLVNALFGTRLPTDPIRPCTTRPTEVTVSDAATDHPLTFVDLPGVGESAAADPDRLAMYRQYLRHADVAIWAMHADSRCLADLMWLRRLLDGEPDRGATLRKITFVLTKADLVHVDPWIVPLTGGLRAPVRVQPGPATAGILGRKCAHAQEMLRSTFGDYGSPGMPIACSSILRHNLTAVLAEVVGRLDDLAIRRLTPHLRTDSLNTSSADDALATCSLMAVDMANGTAHRFADLVSAAVGTPRPGYRTGGAW